MEMELAREAALPIWPEEVEASRLGDALRMGVCDTGLGHSQGGI